MVFSPAVLNRMAEDLRKRVALTEQQTGLRQPSALLRATASFDPAASTLSTQLLRYAIRSMSGGGRNQRRGPPQALGDGSQNKFILGASWTTQSKSAELQDALQVRKPHLELLALTSRLLKIFGASERPGDVPGVFKDARDLREAALRFEHTAQSSLLARYRSVFAAGCLGYSRVPTFL